MRCLAELPDDAVILLRHPAKSDEPGQFEHDVSVLAGILLLEVEWHRPDTDATPGRGSVYHRDIEMVEQSDFALLFLVPEDAEEGYSGTMHLMEKAIDAGRPVYAYTVAKDGRVERVGEYDPFHQYSHLVPQG